MTKELVGNAKANHVRITEGMIGIGFDSKNILRIIKYLTEVLMEIDECRAKMGSLSIMRKEDGKVLIKKHDRILGDD